MHGLDEREAGVRGTGLIYGLEDRPGWGTAVFVGFQHFLAMFASIITPSLVLCRGVGAETVGVMLSASLLTSGVATWIQIHRLGVVGSGLLSVQGTSSAFIAVMAGMEAALAAEGASPEEALGTMLGTSRRRACSAGSRRRGRCTRRGCGAGFWRTD